MKKNKLPFSIIIPCADDVRIEQCLNSIDENVEVVVVLNGATNEVMNIVKKYKNVKKVNIPERNLAKSLNVGIENSKYSKVLFMDSDCVFDKGAIRKLYEGLRNHYLSKGKVVFQSNGLISSIIARVREYTTADKPNAYKPPLAIRKSIKKLVGGYYFDPEVIWTEDADFNLRVLRANIEIEFVPSAKIFHPPLTFRQDLRSAFRYGFGKSIRVKKNIAQGIGTHFREVDKLISRKGFWAGIYYLIWNCFYLCGYAYHSILSLYSKKNSI